MFERIATFLGLRPKTRSTTAPAEEMLAGKLESLLESTADAIVGVESKGCIAFVNPQTERLFGYLRHELLGKPLELLLPEVFRPAILGRRTLFFLDPQTRPMGEGLDLRGRRKDGAEFPAGVGVSRFQHEELVAMFFIRDMTDIVQAEQALLESREEFRVIVETAPDAMVIVDSEGQIQLVNAETEKLFGHSREELLGQAVEVLVPEDVRGKHRKHRAGYLAEPRVRAAGQGLEAHGQRKDGSVFPVEIRLSPLHTKEGILVSSVIRDVTERKRAQEALQASEKGKASVLGQLAAGVCHELRNPLGVISNAAYYLKTVLPDADENVKGYLEMICSEVDNSERIVSDLLDLSRTLPAEREEIAVAGLVTAVLERMPPPEGIEVAVDIEPALPVVLVDLRQLVQVLRNLVANAYQAMPEGGTLAITAEAAEDGTQVSVADTGVGIAPENMEHLFEPLFTTKARGIGLGLAVSKNLVEVNGGRIEVESEEGKGSTFRVVLPAGGE